MFEYRVEWDALLRQAWPRFGARSVVAAKRAKLFTVTNLKQLRDERPENTISHQSLT